MKITLNDGPFCGVEMEISEDDIYHPAVNRADECWESFTDENGDGCQRVVVNGPTRDQITVGLCHTFDGGEVGFKWACYVLDDGSWGFTVEGNTVIKEPPGKLRNDRTEPFIYDVGETKLFD